jgi:hypothetical protein
MICVGILSMSVNSDGEIKITTHCSNSSASDKILATQIVKLDALSRKIDSLERIIVAKDVELENKIKSADKSIDSLSIILKKTSYTATKLRERSQMFP